MTDNNYDSKTQAKSYNVDDLIYLMERLRDPDSGCPWDIKQDYRSITPSTLEEAYEVVDAIEHGDYGHLKEELGDFLFQVIFYSQLAKEEQRFDFHQVVDLLTAKLVRRHPHVFPDGTLASRRDSKPNAIEEQAIKLSWEQIKQEERNAKGNQGLLDDVPISLPATSRAAKLQKRAAKIGFDWPNAHSVIDKVEEELEELKQAIAAADEIGNKEAITEELGDLMFSCVNLSRHLKLDPEAVLRSANQKFERRFGILEKMLQDKLSQQTLSSHSRNELKANDGATCYQDQKFEPELLESLWQAAKSLEK